MQAQYAATDFVLPDEPCIWIRDREETDAILNIPIRVRYICVVRNGALAIFREALGTPSMLGIEGVPPITYQAGMDRVGDSIEQVEKIWADDHRNPPPLPIVINGESYVEIEHPALEVIPDVTDYSRRPY